METAKRLTSQQERELYFKHLREKLESIRKGLSKKDNLPSSVVRYTFEM